MHFELRWYADGAFNLFEVWDSSANGLGCSPLKGGETFVAFTLFVVAPIDFFSRVLVLWSGFMYPL